MKYPTIEEVEKASHREICGWWRFLKSPGYDALDNPETFKAVCDTEAAVMARIGGRLRDFGGFTPEISKSLGWRE